MMFDIDYQTAKDTMYAIGTARVAVMQEYAECRRSWALKEGEENYWSKKKLDENARLLELQEKWARIIWAIEDASNTKALQQFAEEKKARRKAKVAA